MEHETADSSAASAAEPMKEDTIEMPVEDLVLHVLDTNEKLFTQEDVIHHIEKMTGGKVPKGKITKALRNLHRNDLVYNVYMSKKSKSLTSKLSSHLPTAEPRKKPKKGTVTVPKAALEKK